MILNGYPDTMTTERGGYVFVLRVSQSGVPGPTEGDLGGAQHLTVGDGCKETIPIIHLKVTSPIKEELLDDRDTIFISQCILKI